MGNVQIEAKVNLDNNSMTCFTRSKGEIRKKGSAFSV